MTYVWKCNLRMRGALPWPGLVFAHLLRWNFGFDPIPVSVGFVVDYVAV